MRGLLHRFASFWLPLPGLMVLAQGSRSSPRLPAWCTANGGDVTVHAAMGVPIDRNEQIVANARLSREGFADSLHVGGSAGVGLWFRVVMVRSLGAPKVLCATEGIPASCGGMDPSSCHKAFHRASLDSMFD